MAGFKVYMQRFWDVISSPSHQPHVEVPLITSLCYYALAILMGRILRLTIQKYVPPKFQAYFFDAATTFQVLACSLENGQIKNHYGFGAYGAVLFLLSFWVALTVKDGSANPCSYMINYSKGKIPFQRFLIHLVFQLVGGLSSYRFARTFWSFGLTEGHAQRYVMSHCVADLTVSVPTGITVETLCTLFDTLLCLTTFTQFLHWESASKCLIGALMTVFGVHLTGMYLNPINATNQTFGCHGATAFDHFLVYWVGPLTAAFVGAHLHTLIKNSLAATKKDLINNNSETINYAFSNGQRDHKGTSYGKQRLSKEPVVSPGKKGKTKAGLLKRSLRNREVYFAD